MSRHRSLSLGCALVSSICWLAPTVLLDEGLGSSPVASTLWIIAGSTTGALAVYLAWVQRIDKA